MKPFLLGALCLLTTLAGRSQVTHTISGYVKDQSNGEALIGAYVKVVEIGQGSGSNMYGFYSLSLPPGTYTLQCKYIGYNDYSQTVTLHSDVTQDIELPVEAELLQEVVIQGEAPDQNVTSTEMSVEELDIKTIEKMPAFAGEVDIIKSIQLMPGVTTVGEGASGFNVRGGSVDQNLVLLDEAPVYQSSHVFGFFSVFNPDAVKDIKLYKGGIPAQYGGRLSSILDIRMKEGNYKEYDVTGGIGTVFSRLAIEGPIKKDKASFIVAARRSYADVIARAVSDAIDDDAALYFYDLTAKANVILNEKNRLYASSYFGRDNFKLDKFQGFDWGNKTATLRWNHTYGSKLFSNLSAYYSKFDYGFQLGENENDKYDWKSAISTFNIKPQFIYYANADNEIRFGGESILYLFEPANAVTVSEGSTTDISLDERKGMESAVYLSNDQKIGDRLALQYGIRLSHFNYLGGRVYHYRDTLPGIEKPLDRTEEKEDWESIADYLNLEPRLAVKYQLNDQSSVKASYNRMAQYIQLMSNTTAATPIDIWQPATNNIKPQLGDQIALGYFRNFKNNQYETSAEVYYKWSQQRVDYIDGADIFINRFIESQLLEGEGRAYGLELSARKTKGRLTGWVSYTLGKTELKVNGINYGSDKEHRKGGWYPTRFDQRHNLKLAGFYDLTDRISLSANFTFLSGTPTTFPTDRLVVAGYVIPYISGSVRHNYRIPSYHRLDLGMTVKNVWRGKKNRKGEDDLVISIYNAYARKNPFSIYFTQGTERQDTSVPATTRAGQLAIIGTVLPAISYNFKF